jgi:transketolase
MFAAHHKLDNLVAIIDRNGQCVTDFTENFNRLEPLDSKWRSFGWSVKRINGHSFEELRGAFKDIREQKAPLVIIADTVKGKGVSFMERVPKWHHGVPSKEEFERAKDELEKCRY